MTNYQQYLVIFTLRMIFAMVCSIKFDVVHSSQKECLDLIRQLDQEAERILRD